MARNKFKMSGFPKHQVAKKPGPPLMGDYSTETGRRLSTLEADELIDEEGEDAVTSTYDDAIRRAKTDAEREAAEKRMAELEKTEEGRKKIEADREITKELEDTYDEGADFDEYTWNPETSEQGLVEGWGGKGADPRDEGGITPTTDAIEQRKADAAAEKKRAVDAINKKYEESGEKSGISEEFTWGG